MSGCSTGRRVVQAAALITQAEFCNDTAQVWELSSSSIDHLRCAGRNVSGCSTGKGLSAAAAGYAVGMLRPAAC
jgi:hypothetical protein